MTPTWPTDEAVERAHAAQVARLSEWSDDDKVSGKMTLHELRLDAMRAALSTLSPDPALVKALETLKLNIEGIDPQNYTAPNDIGAILYELANDIDAALAQAGAVQPEDTNPLGPDLWVDYVAASKAYITVTAYKGPLPNAIRYRAISQEAGE